MMKPIVLFYNVSDRTRLLKIYQALLPLGFRIKLVEKEEYGQPLGVLAGLDKETEAESLTDLGEEKITSAPASGLHGERVDFSDEMAVMAGFTSAQVDLFILALRKKGVGRIDYKAVLTPTNRSWDSVKLYQEIKKEHESMQTGKS